MIKEKIFLKLKAMEGGKILLRSLECSLEEEVEGLSTPIGLANLNLMIEFYTWFMKNT
jgi:hypothetical protein